MLTKIMIKKNDRIITSQRRNSEESLHTEICIEISEYECPLSLSTQMDLEYIQLVELLSMQICDESLSFKKRWKKMKKKRKKRKKNRKNRRKKRKNKGKKKRKRKRQNPNSDLNLDLYPRSGIEKGNLENQEKKLEHILNLDKMEDSLVYHCPRGLLSHYIIKNFCSTQCKKKRRKKQTFYITMTETTNYT